jgi:hypothetical protein
MTTLKALCRDAGQNYDFALEFLAQECAKGIGCQSYQAAVDRGESAYFDAKYGVGFADGLAQYVQSAVYTFANAERQRPASTEQYATDYAARC